MEKLPPSLRDQPDRDTTQGAKPPVDYPGEPLAEHLARDFLADALHTPYLEAEAVESVLLPRANQQPQRAKPPESLGDQLARDNLNHILDYMEFHDGNKKKLIEQVRDVGRIESVGLITREQMKQKILKVSLEYYASEVAQLGKLDDSSIGASDFAKKQKAEVRAEVERALRATKILQTKP